MSSTTTHPGPAAAPSPAPSGPAPSRPHDRLRRLAARVGPVLAVYGVLKLAGFTVFMLLLDSAA